MLCRILDAANRNAVDASVALRGAADKFLDAIDKSLETYGADHNASGGDVPQSIKMIDDSMAEISSDLKILQRREGSTIAS